MANFDSYKIWFYSDYTYTALIYCYKEGQYAGRISFYPDGQNLPQNSQFNEIPNINFHHSKFDDITKILRHESPLYLFYNASSHVGGIGTSSMEPTGEEE